MAKRKKTGTTPATSRRSTRRGKQAGEAAPEGELSQAEGEPSTAGPSTALAAHPPPDSNTQEPSTDPHPPENTEPNTLEAITKPCQVPIVALHKKFGKYRCLFNNEDAFTRKYEVGSDSETNSSVEIKVVDPCASSESDSNAALDTQSDTNSGVGYSPLNSAANVTKSRDISPVTFVKERTMNEIPFLCENDEPQPEPVAPGYLQPADESVQVVEACQAKPIEIVTEHTIKCTEHPTPAEAPQDVIQDIPLEEEQNLEYGVDDDEIITVVQIVEDDNPELYYDINIGSPTILDQNTFIDPTENPLSGENDIQKHFESLKLANIESQSSMECSEINEITLPSCETPDLSFHKEESLSRPDPSITPSSTLSDDSNSSRVAEIVPHSNDSAESSPTGVRRSSRIKTISNLKQKTKGYGLVKTPLKKALITQTKLKLEELGSDSQEKSNDYLTAPNSPSFPVPSEMPVKVKSRWRRSSELEMCANSPASSPLASPNLPKLPPIVENENNELEEIVPLSKEAYDKIIEDRINQYQHLDENEYLCERMISKDTKKMICDCFMTKEELERGELACGEDCLNRLLMIEW